MHPNNPNQPPIVPGPPPPPPPPGMNPGWQQPPSMLQSPQHAEQMRQALQSAFPSQPVQPYVIPARQFNHGKHVIADILTIGFWLPFHLLLWAMHDRKSTVVYPDGRRVRR